MSLHDEVEASISASSELSEAKFAGARALALMYARQIDVGVEAGGQDATKALYLGPHLLKTLGELGLSPNPTVKRPVGRPPKSADDAGGEEAKPDELSAARERHRRRGA